MDLCAKVVTILSLLCFGSLSGAYAFMVSLVRVIVGNVKERYNKKWHIGFCILALAYIVVMFMQFEGISSVLVCSTGVISLISVWYLSAQRMRFIAIFNGIIYFTYLMIIGNLSGLLELFAIISSAVAYFRYRRKAE